MQAQEMASAYHEVLEGDSDMLKISLDVYELLKGGRRLHIDIILKQVAKGDRMLEPNIRTACEAMVNGKFMQKSGVHLDETYWFIDLPDEEIKDKVINKFEDKDADKPKALKDYYEKYGFDDLVRTVATQIDHNDSIVRKYDEDRLWLGRFVDFLDKAKEWFYWHKSDQAIARMKIRKLKNSSKK